MTLRMSAVAVCRSKASFVSLNSRAFSIAMTAWSAKVRSNSTWCGENGPGFLRVTTMTPMAVPLLIRGEYNRLRIPRARAVSVNGKSGWASVSGISTVSPACANAKFGLLAIGHGNRLFSNSSAAGLIGVNVAR